MNLLKRKLAPSMPAGWAALLMLAAGCTSRGAARVIAFESSVDWSSPTSHLPDRMLVKNEGLYRAVWAGADGRERLVVLSRSPQDLFGIIYNVAVITAEGQTVHRGRVHCQEQTAPYCLVEIRTSSSRAPAELRDRWRLAVGLWDEREEFDENLPIVLDEGDHIAGTGGDGARNVVTIEPVRWSDEPDWATGAGVLYADPFDARPAEPARAWPIPD